MRAAPAQRGRRRGPSRLLIKDVRIFDEITDRPRPRTVVVKSNLTDGRPR